MICGSARRRCGARGRRWCCWRRTRLPPPRAGRAAGRHGRWAVWRRCGDGRGHPGRARSGGMRWMRAGGSEGTPTWAGRAAPPHMRRRHPLRADGRRRCVLRRLWPGGDCLAARYDGWHGRSRWRARGSWLGGTRRRGRRGMSRLAPGRVPGRGGMLGRACIVSGRGSQIPGRWMMNGRWMSIFGKASRRRTVQMCV